MWSTRPSYGPAGSPSVFAAIVNLMAEFGFIIAAVLGAAAGTTDLKDGVFRHLVITGRSRLALYLARIPAGLAILLPLVAVAFTMVCLVTSYEGVPQPTSVGRERHLHPGSPRPGPAADLGPTASRGRRRSLSRPSGSARHSTSRPTSSQDIATLYADYAAAENASSIRRSTRWSRSGCGSSSRSGSGSWSG